MSLVKKNIVLMSLILFVSACQSLPEEIYKDYFYQTKDAQEIKQFTYILYLGDHANQQPHAGSEQGSLDTPKRQKSGGHTKRKRSTSKSTKGRDSEYSSIAFQMEEEAYQRLEKKLEAVNFCSNDITYQLSEYTWLRYTIKGSCEGK
ncbi:MAG: hypothetical protein Q9M92_07105 [Enterobacterales bacterium]|nr:hypothetical protein [Enterobacterales bacterium]